MGLRLLAFTKLNFARQFLLVSFLILLAGMLIIGTWVGQQIETGVINRTAAVTALYVDSFISQYLQDLGHTNQLGMQQQAQLDLLLTNTPLGERIVAFKVWKRDGTVLYSTNQMLIGRSFAITPPLLQAFKGEVYTEISNLSDSENEYERERWLRLLETYAPVREQGTDAVIAVAEFYQTTQELEREVAAAQWSSWLVVGAATLAMYFLLVGLVRQASNKIISQEADLKDKVKQLTALLAQNQVLRTRVHRAAANTTALNERFLRRIAADLHDGSAQDLALALLRIESLAETCNACARKTGKEPSVSEDLRVVQTALQSALTDLRTLSSGLRLPALETLSTTQVAERALSDYERKTGKTVDLIIRDLPKDAPLPVKITLYRLLQESLTNGYRHGDGIGQQVRIRGGDDLLWVEVADAGPGFDPQTAPTNGHLGLAGMKERVEILEGLFEVESVRGGGTTIRACLPLSVPEVEDG